MFLRLEISHFFQQPTGVGRAGDGSCRDLALRFVQQEGAPVGCVLIETYKRCGRPSCHCIDGPGHGPKRYLSTIARTGERPRLGYVPNATYPQVAAFLANYRKLQEMLNEICAINAELLRRRESLD